LCGARRLSTCGTIWKKRSLKDISLAVGRIVTDYQLGIVYQIVNPVGDGFSVINLVSNVVSTLTREQAVTLATTVQ
jgi:hypothetical protein